MSTMAHVSLIHFEMEYYISRETSPGDIDAWSTMVVFRILIKILLVLVASFDLFRKLYKIFIWGEGTYLFYFLCFTLIENKVFCSVA